MIDLFKKIKSHKTCDSSVGRTGFEPATPWSQTTYSTGLNYLPNFKDGKDNRIRPILRINYRNKPFDEADQ
jgi:hypothetical protein